MITICTDAKAIQTTEKVTEIALAVPIWGAGHAVVQEPDHFLRAPQAAQTLRDCLVRHIHALHRNSKRSLDTQLKQGRQAHAENALVGDAIETNAQGHIQSHGSETTEPARLTGALGEPNRPQENRQIHRGNTFENNIWPIPGVQAYAVV